MDLPTHQQPKSGRGVRALLAAVVGLALVWGAVSFVPTSATAATSITSIWKAIRKKADRRYYTKAGSDARYYSRAQTDERFYTRAQSDTRYFTRGQVETQFASKPSMVRGGWAWTVSDAGQQRYGMDDITFGLTMASAPQTHYIKIGDAVPQGCSGTVTDPSATAGHLCVFEGAATNVAVSGISTLTNEEGANRFAAVVYGYGVLGLESWAEGSWALGVD
ncbi:MAG: hypothetical protein V9F00_01080 [Nocardioides sp.]